MSWQYAICRQAMIPAQVHAEIGQYRSSQTRELFQALDYHEHPALLRPETSLAVLSACRTAYVYPSLADQTNRVALSFLSRLPHVARLLIYVDGEPDNLSDGEEDPEDVTLHALFEQIGHLPSRPAIQSLQITAESAERHYIICSSLGGIRIGSLSLTGLGFEVEEELRLPNSMPNLNLQVSRLELKTASNGTLDAYARIVQLDKVRHLSLPNDYTFEADDSFVPGLSQLHSLDWSDPIYWALDERLSWLSNLQRIRTSDSATGLALVEDNCETLLEIAMHSDDPSQLESAIGAFFVCECLTTVDLKLEAIEIETEQSLLHCLGMLADYCEKYSIYLALSLESSCRDLVWCMSHLAGIARHLHHLTIAYRYDDESQDSWEISSTSSTCPDVTCFTFPQLTSLSLSIKAAANESSHQEWLALPPITQHHMPLLSSLNIEIVSHEVSYLPVLGHAISSGYFPHLEAFRGEFGLLLGDVSLSESEELHWDARSALDIKQEFIKIIKAKGLQEELRFKYRAAP